MFQMLRRYKGHIALYFLILFIGVKLSGVHAFVHVDDEQHEDCHLCEYVLSTNKTPLVQSIVYCSEPVLIETSFKKEFNHYYTSSVEKAFNYSLFSRPPPLA